MTLKCKLPGLITKVFLGLLLLFLTSYSLKRNNIQEESILKFNTQTLATWDEKVNGWNKDWPKLNCDATITFLNDSTIKLYFKVSNTKKVTNKVFKWTKRLDKNQDGKSWINYTLTVDEKSEFFFVNLEKDSKNNIVDALFINDKSMIVFFNQ